MLTFNFSPFPVIRTERLILRQPVMEDAADLFVMRADKDVMKYIDRPLATKTEDAEALLKVFADLLSKQEAITWGITLKDSPALVGTIGFWRMVPEDHRSEIGYLLHKDLWRKGIMKEAIQAVLEYGFKTMKLHSVEAHISPENTASARLVESNGFIREAYFKDYHFFEGRYKDMSIYSLINPWE